MTHSTKLSRRERQIMDVLFARGEATVNEIHADLPDGPDSTEAVRAMMNILVEKNHVTRRDRGREKVYSPREAKEKAGRSALQRVLETFFGGSLDEAVSAHLMSRKDKITDEEFDRLIERIKQTKQETR